MSQIGYNAGPRHCRVFGTAKSYNKKISLATMIEHDLDAMALLNLMWGFARVHMPQECISAVDEAHAASGLPRLATRNVEPGMQYIF